MTVTGCRVDVSARRAAGVVAATAARHDSSWGFDSPAAVREKGSGPGAPGALGTESCMHVIRMCPAHGLGWYTDAFCQPCKHCGMALFWTQHVPQRSNTHEHILGGAFKDVGSCLCVSMDTGPGCRPAAIALRPGGVEPGNRTREASRCTATWYAIPNGMLCKHQWRKSETCNHAPSYTQHCKRLVDQRDGVEHCGIG
jgi:hypothetical protein